jgi:hypothetical protein
MDDIRGTDGRFGIFVDHDVVTFLFKKFFEVDDAGELKMGFLASITITCSQEVKVAGAIG